MLIDPARLERGCCAYTGAHDNNTTRGWFATLPAQQKKVLAAYVRQAAVETRDGARALMGLAWSSSAALERIEVTT